MVSTPSPGDLLARARRDVGRSLRRARNGVKYVTGVDRPQVGQSPKDVVWRRDRAELWHYRNDDVTTRTPVLVVMSLISRSYVLDLSPGASFVAALRDAGLDVYLLDWGVPDARDADNGLSTYVDDHLPAAVEAVLADSGADTVNLLGYCYGGILSLLLGAAHPELPVSSLITLATPVDFDELGMFGRMLDEGRLEPDDVVDETGNVPPDTIHTAFRLLKPTGEVSKYAVLWQKLPDERQMKGFAAMEQWTQDHIPFPGRAFRETVDLMRDQALVHDRVHLGGRRVSLRDLRWPLLNVLAEQDHIVPKRSAQPVSELVGSSEAETLELPAGHVGMVMGGSASTTTMPEIVRWLREHSEPA